ncbi:MAG: hypothetical protein R2827_12945 [Bdellovibrionales bacterium]
MKASIYTMILLALTTTAANAESIDLKRALSHGKVQKSLAIFTLDPFK